MEVLATRQGCACGIAVFGARGLPRQGRAKVLAPTLGSGKVIADDLTRFGRATRGPVQRAERVKPDRPRSDGGRAADHPPSDGVGP